MQLHMLNDNDYNSSIDYNQVKFIKLRLLVMEAFMKIANKIRCIYLILAFIQDTAVHLFSRIFCNQNHPYTLLQVVEHLTSLSKDYNYAFLALHNCASLAHF